MDKIVRQTSRVTLKFNPLLSSLQAAHIAKDNHVDDVMDSLLTTLSKFASIDTTRPSLQALVAFGGNRLSMAAMQSLFTVVADYGDMLRTGWDHAVGCVMQLHKVSAYNFTVK